MNIFNVSWSISTDFPGRGGNMDNPDWATIEEKLQIILQSAGTVTLEAEDENERSRSLQIRAENDMYFMTFGVETEDDWVVRTYKNPEAEPQRVSILGDVWNAQAICHDKAIVMAIFQEFFNTGDVSKKYLA